VAMEVMVAVQSGTLPFWGVFSAVVVVVCYSF